MKTIRELELGFSDAQNYAQRAYKDMFNRVFVRNSYLDEIVAQKTFFIVGEKGTGKTAYATYLNNNTYLNNKSILKFIYATDYEKFYTLKTQKHLGVTDYNEIWKVILCLLLCTSVAEDDKVISFMSKSGLDDLLSAIDEYYMHAFSPEIMSVLNMIEESEIAAKIMCKYMEVGASDTNKREFSETRLQINLYYIRKQFVDTIAKLKLNKNINLLIDGIDIRPERMPFEDYIECIRGLANACWSLNTELFQNIRDTKGRFRVILLLRPDIFKSLNLQNATNKLLDNSVYLDWRTTYIEYKHSLLYKISCKLLSYNQTENMQIEEYWNQYFTWQLQTTSLYRSYDTAFMSFLKISLSRPRDILVILSILREKMIEHGMGDSYEFSSDIYKSDSFQNAYSEYFLSSLSDQLSFYYSDVDFRNFTKFFDYFDKSEFTYKQYNDNYYKYIDYLLENAKELPKFVETPKEFLQLLYDCNVIAAIEKDVNCNPYIHFSYRERSKTDIAPEVLYEPRIEYRFHYGLYKKAKFGRF